MFRSPVLLYFCQRSSHSEAAAEKRNVTRSIATWIIELEVLIIHV